MVQLTPQSRILLATEPVDFRKGIDSLAAVCRKVLGEQPLSGAIFVFRNRAATAIKLLFYDGQGFWFEFIPIKSSVAMGSGAPGSYAGHSRVPSPDHERPPSTDGSGL